MKSARQIIFPIAALINWRVMEVGIEIDTSLHSNNHDNDLSSYFYLVDIQYVELKIDIYLTIHETTLLHVYDISKSKWAIC